MAFLHHDIYGNNPRPLNDKCNLDEKIYKAIEEIEGEKPSEVNEKCNIDVFFDRPDMLIYIIDVLNN